MILWNYFYGDEAYVFFLAVLKDGTATCAYLAYYLGMASRID